MAGLACLCGVLMLVLSIANAQQKTTTRNNVIYTFSHFGKNWTSSESACHEYYNGNLVTTPTKNLQDYLASQLNFGWSGEFYWIGLKNESGWRWVTGNPLTTTNWDQVKGVGDCVVALRVNGKWKQMQCSSQHQYICESKFTKQENYFRLNGTGRLHFISHAKLRHQEAVQMCGKVNKQLAVVDTPGLQDLVAQKLNMISGNEFYIGLSMDGNVLTWGDGRTLASTGFSNWDEGYPDIIDERDCVYVNKKGKWRNGLCTTPRNFICQELSPVILPTTTQRDYTTLGMSSTILGFNTTNTTTETSQNIDMTGHFTTTIVTHPSTTSNASYGPTRTTSVIAVNVLLTYVFYFTTM
nr:secretory phospholipase A2 receptor-like isoform X1 [Ciona intestinalis]|eukprot:XP_002132048.2 secretory phospholipase A2 receptor-like isoform X1 [Ciona intestinalis]